MKRKYQWITLPVLAALLVAGLLMVGRAIGAGSPASQTYFPLVWSSAVLSGTVRDSEGPIAGAIVRVQATTNATSTDINGHFSLTGISPGEPARLTAWAEGYYIAGGEAYLPGEEEIGRAHV